MPMSAGPMFPRHGAAPFLSGSEPVSEELEKLRADRAVAELDAYKEAVRIVMGANRDGIAMLERFAAALLARGGF